MISLYDEHCPYGAEDCPKVKELKEIVIENKNELAEVNRNVIRLTTTLKNVSYVITLVVSIMTSVIGASLL